MKIRNGFVSNSSSSSYIIAYEKSFNLEDIIPSKSCRYGDDSYIVTDNLKGLAERLKYYIDPEYQDDEQTAYFVRCIGKASRAKKNGKNIAYVNINYNDQSAYDIINSCNEIEVLESFE